MEGEDLRLEEAIGLFEEGMNLSKELLDRLEKVEKRVELLVRKGRAGAERRELDAGDVLEGGGIGDDDGEEGPDFDDEDDGKEN